MSISSELKDYAKWILIGLVLFGVLFVVASLFPSGCATYDNPLWQNQHKRLSNQIESTQAKMEALQAEKQVALDALNAGTTTDETYFKQLEAQVLKIQSRLDSEKLERDLLTDRMEAAMKAEAEVEKGITDTITEVLPAPWSTLLAGLVPFGYMLVRSRGQRAAMQDVIRTVQPHIDALSEKEKALLRDKQTDAASALVNKLQKPKPKKA